MKQKMQQQVQPRETVLLQNQQVKAEIRSFLRAVHSYPARAVKDPHLSFQRYLSSFVTPARARQGVRSGETDRPKAQSQLKA